ncbi:MAG: formate dehydrogenase accessory protein FdhE [Proteobacteria bacterium]|nr:formate dehydrogenase accessory protein FdhE [Pseudomonadota bacterium]
MSQLKAPELILSSADTPPRILPPGNDLFATRAARFDTLADGHPMEAALRFLAGLHVAQQEAFALPALVAKPDDCSFPASGSQLPAAWQSVLHHLLEHSLPAAPAATRALIAGLRATDPAGLDALGRAVLSDDAGDADAGSRALVWAALQVVWTRHASRMPVSADTPHTERDLCPCCGTPAVAAVVRIGGSVAGLRYLHCPLCNTQWNAMRARCTSCDSVREVSRHRLEDAPANPWPAASAESCEECGSYRKVFYQDKDPKADPIADDLASLALDILMGEAGFARSGWNPFLDA